MPGPATIASDIRGLARRCAPTAERAKPPSRCSAQADDHRFGHGERDLRRDAFDGRDAAACRRPRASPRSRSSSAAPGTSRLPAMIRIRPLVSLSPSTTGGSGCASSAARSSGLPALHRDPAIASGADGLRRALGLERRAVVPQRQLGHAQALGVGLELIGADAAVEHVGLLVDGQDLRLVQLLEDVAHAQHHDLVADDQHAAVAIMQVDGVHHRAQPQDDVGPALAAGRAGGRICRAARGARLPRGISRGCRASSAGRTLRTRARAAARR